MCRINLNISTTTPNGTTITSANGRYRMVGATTWTNFTVNLLNPTTPDITTIGQYELQISVTNNIGQTSTWASGSFEVSSNCGGGNQCVEYSIFANSGVLFSVSYTDCNGTTKTLTVPGGDEAPICSTTYPSIISGSGSISLTGLDNCSTNTCTSYRLTNGTQSDLGYSYIPCGSTTRVNNFIGGFETITVCVAENTQPIMETGISSVQVGTCTGGGTTTTTTTTSTTPTGTFSAGMSVNESHALPSVDPDSETITGTLTVSNGPKTYGLTIKNQFNYGNVSTGYLSITGIGSLTVTTNGTSTARQAIGSLYVPVGTYTYTLRATLDIISPMTSGVATATIIEI